MEHCAGVIVYKKVDTDYQILLCHPGGPYFINKNVWGIPKGHIESGEQPSATAHRELQEETGLDCDIASLHYIGEFKQNSNKRVTIYELNSDYDLSKFTCNLSTIEYPEKSGNMITIPENDCAQWFSYQDAVRVIFKGQQKFLLNWRQAHE